MTVTVPTPAPTPFVDYASDIAESFKLSTFDPLMPADLLHDEILQRRESGFDVDEIAAATHTTDPADRAAVLALVDKMDTAVRRVDWTYEEPDALNEIQSTWSQRPQAVSPDPLTLNDKIHAAWLGRIAGCNVGKPVESGDHWTVERIRSYLELAGEYPLNDYFPKIDPIPDMYELRENWPDTTKGNVTGSARDDDIDYPILALHLLEKYGKGLRPQHVGAAWLELFPLTQVYTAERAAYINLTDGFTVPEISMRRNPYREWIGAQIRGDVFGYVNPGDPVTAATQSYQDASLSHVGNGIYGEMWSAALVAAAFTAPDAETAIRSSLAVVPPRSRLYEAVLKVLELRAAGITWDAAIIVIRQNYGHYAWVHTINNAALVTAGLLWGEGDYMKSVSLTVMGGWDTDSNGATVGSVAAILVGTHALPARLIDPLENRTRSALFGYDNSVISELADRTYRLAVDGLR